MSFINLGFFDLKLLKPIFIILKYLLSLIFYKGEIYFIVIPNSSAVGIKGMRIQFRDGSGQHVPSLCGGALHAPPALLRGAPPPFD